MVLSYNEFLNENFDIRVGDVVTIKGKKYLITKVLPDGFEASNYVIEGDYIVESENIVVKGKASYIHKNIGKAKVFSMLGEFTFESEKDMGKDTASELVKQIFGK